ncbi:MAG: glycosyltransferase family 2 protein [Candidatus Saccharibacteria bacterium]|nr:glycosyltransferase family 2 protein [Candidatus Saccharibacteria bacterium]
MKSRKRVAVLIPCYNEEKTIGKVVNDCKRELGNKNYGVTIYVYDNNSSDKTAEVAAKAGAMVKHEHRQGKGNVIRSMLRDIEADCYLMIDGDDTYPLDEADKLCRAVLGSGVDMAVGDRLSSTYFKENKRAFHGIGNKLVRFLINVLFHAQIRDMMTGYRALSHDFAKTFPVLSRGFELEVEMTIFALGHGFYIDELPVQYRDRPEGSESKLKTYSDGFKVLKRIMTLFEEYRPALFFSLVALIFFIVSLGFAIPVFQEYFTTGLVERFPTLIFAGFLMIIAVLSMMCGIILEVVAKKHRQLFELNLNNLRMRNENGRTDN